MHMILKMDVNWQLAGADAITIQQRGKVETRRITKAGDSYLRTLLVQGARSVLIGAGKRTDSFSRWVCMLVERRGYWRAVVAIAAKNARLCWASLHYGDDFRLYSVN